MSDNIESFGAHRARTANDAALISPRDMLTMVLADIDAGAVAPDFVCVCLHKRTTATESGLSNFVLAGTHNLLDVVGLLEIVKDLVFRNVEKSPQPGTSHE